MKIEAVVFDMDGVLVDVKSSWQYVHKSFGTTNQGNLNLYLSREISYAELMRRDIALWGKIHIDEIRKVLSSVPLMRGAERTISALKAAGVKTAVISAGISILAEQLRIRLGIDRVFANSIHIDEEGFITGEGDAMVDLNNKVHTLKTYLLKERTSSLHCAVVGDSVYDIPLFELAALSIAFNELDKRVTEAADVTIQGKDLSRILPYLVR